jgi:dipeptidyl aminopeptidase/acylaminoacyl peptidase
MVEFRLSRGDRNYGTAYLPDSAPPNGAPVLIYCHGGGTGAGGDLGGAFAAMRDRAAAEGMVFVTFDCFAAGRTGGDYGKMTYARWAQNLSDVVDWVQEQPFSDPARIGAVGFSCGSTTALRLAARDTRLKAVCSVGSCVTVHIGMGGGGAAKRFAENRDALRAGERRSLFGVDFEEAFFLDDICNAPVHALHEKKITCPVLFLQGLEDNPYRCADARLAYDLMRRAGLPAKLIEYPGGSHGLGEKAAEATEDLFGWLREIHF